MSVADGKDELEMRNVSLVALVILCLGACSGVETSPGDTTKFAAGNYQYFTWRSEPLVNSARSSADIYKLDPILRRQINAALAEKGYVQDGGRAQFSVDYLLATGMRDGQKSEAASNITPYPSVRPNQHIDGASVDNAHALGGVKQTNKIAIQLNDVTSKQEIWHVVIEKIVENANLTDTLRMERTIGHAVRQGLRELPDAAP